VITDEIGLQRLQAEWNTLLQQSFSNTIFLTWEWVLAWWRSYGSEKRLWILRVERDGRLVGLVPLYSKIFSKLKAFRYRGLYLIGDGSGDSDYLDVITRAGEEEFVIVSIVTFLLNHRDQWDILFLNEIPETSQNLKLLKRLFRQSGCYWTESNIPCTYVNLPTDWAGYLKSLKPRMRTKIRSVTRRLEESHKIRVDCCAGAADLNGRLESLFELHNRRWRSNGKEGVFLCQNKRRFYQEMSALFMSRGWLRFYSLAIDDRYAAHQFCFEYQERTFLLQEGYDPDWAGYGIGNVLRGYVFQDCIERGIKIYDFLGGVTPHKLSWGGRTKTSVRGVIALPVIRNRALLGLPKVVRWAKRRLKSVLPEPVLQWSRFLKP
jgi:CelD/BcsL family acetyltransferase involved in cellulose biosynthesis